MNYDIIPSYNELFDEDTFKIPNLPGINETAYALSFLGYLYTEKEVMNKTFFEESVGVKGINISKASEHLKNKVLIKELGVLSAWKIIFEKLKKSLYIHMEDWILVSIFYIVR